MPPGTASGNHTFDDVDDHGRGQDGAQHAARWEWRRAVFCDGVVGTVRGGQHHQDDYPPVEESEPRP
jgi:hypothetical protein